jgi:hypothetical protein
MYKSFKIVALLFILVASPLSVNGQIQNLSVAPVDTDSAINRNFANHSVAWNESFPQKNLLFVLCLYTSLFGNIC